MKLIVGLGNPGLRYRNTRHNAGFLAVDNFAKANKVKIDRKRFGSLFHKMVFNKEEILLLKPQTFMNNSGEAVKAVVSDFAVSLNDILVVCDDINLELGIIRFRAQGSSGGHKGLKSVIEKLDNKNFNRLRIGIGAKSRGTLTEHVLSGFRPEEKKSLKEIVRISAYAIEVWIRDGIEASMNEFNIKKNGGELIEKL